MRPRHKWIESVWCQNHGDTACDCDPYLLARSWLMITKPPNYGAAITQFIGDGPFYGTWEVAGGGRTGPMDDLDACKLKVEQEVMRRVQPN